MDQCRQAQREPTSGYGVKKARSKACPGKRQSANRTYPDVECFFCTLPEAGTRKNGVADRSEVA